ncbi:hypothetical protein [Corallococcus terminator]|uniref:hypothetical protein n=1 Tax=Corallococcus terminator TaxID=2316733 RepID=UPI0011C3B0C2|nr:hypothetical protein [Corallococcus terminator]
MKITAPVDRFKNQTKGAEVASLEINQEEGAFYLIRLSAQGQYIADTWHPSIEEAMRQAKHEFSVDPGDWSKGD